ncbi:MAG: serine protease [Elusimicrobiaceae bacterium]|nr:serine protease [Elusimicrobiaceae bacterium]
MNFPLSAQNVPGKIVRAISSAEISKTVGAVALQAQLVAGPSKTVLAKSVFRAYPQGQEGTHALSGYVFKTTYQGKEEIFGVIATHGLPLGYNKGTLGIDFTARILADGKEVGIPARIVRIGSPIMLDVSLVKFRSEDEPLLTPLMLADQEPAVGDKLYTIGFGVEQLSFLPDRPLFQKSLFSLRFPLQFSLNRAGLCGSPVLNSAGKVVGTFTGDGWLEDSNNDIGFATKSSYLYTLIAAYHNEAEKATFPLMLGEHKIVDLQIDEYVSLIQLEDGAGNQIYRRAINHKFPHTTIMKYLPNARYVKLSINKVWWTGYGLAETSLLDAYYVTYDLQEKRIIKQGRGFSAVPWADKYTKNPAP